MKQKLFRMTTNWFLHGIFRISISLRVSLMPKYYLAMVSILLIRLLRYGNSCAMIKLIKLRFPVLSHDHQLYDVIRKLSISLRPPFFTWSTLRIVGGNLSKETQNTLYIYCLVVHSYLDYSLKRHTTIASVEALYNNWVHP